MRSGNWTGAFTRPCCSASGRTSWTRISAISCQDRDGRGALTVTRFVEKPSLVAANELIQAGGLWNTFIVVSTGLALLELYRKRFPEIVDVMRSALESDRRASWEGAAMAELYERLPVVDFSRDLLAEQLTALRVLPVRPCGWSDLGTPERVAGALRRTPRPVEAPQQSSVGYLSLAEQYERVR
ncbi:nucleotidyl transferase, partial [mine drainage metagenome]